VSCEDLCNERNGENLQVEDVLGDKDNQLSVNSGATTDDREQGKDMRKSSMFS
jgi:hypothetical protein